MFSKKTIKISLIFFNFILFYLFIHHNEDKSYFKVVKNKIPVSIKEKIKLFLFPYKLKDERDIWRDISFQSRDIILKSNFTFTISNIETLKERRNLIYKKYLLDKNQVNISEILKNEKEFGSLSKQEEKLKNSQIFKSTYYNINHFGFFHPSKRTCDKKFSDLCKWSF